MYLNNFLLILGEMAIYFGAMLALFRVRRLLGIGAFFCALGATHFLETYLAVAFYLKMPFGLALSPGSAVLFSGKLALLLLTYIREDAPVARQPLYGMLLGNFILFLLVALLALDHVRIPLVLTLDVPFLGKFAALMVWGNLLLFLECLTMFVVYERLSRTFRCGVWLSVSLTLLIALTVDQLGYFSALHLIFGIPLSAGIGGWIGKVFAAAIYGGVLTWYLTRIEVLPAGRGRTLRQVWETMRLRHPHVLRPAAGRYDPVSGSFHEDQFEPICRHLLSLTALTGRPMSLLLISIDGLDGVDASQPGRRGILRRVGDTISETVRSGDYVVRYRDVGFAVFTPGAPHQAAMQVAASLRARIEALSLADGGARESLCMGVATAPQDGEAMVSVLQVAEARIAAARSAGRNRVVGMFER